MILSHLVRVGRRWINPEHLIYVEDLSRPPASASGADDELEVSVIRGEHFVLRGDDAATLRRLLEDAGAPEAAPEGEPAPPGDRGDGGPPRVLSGRGPRPLVVRPAPDVAGEVSE